MGWSWRREVNGPVSEQLDNGAQDHDEENGQLANDVMWNGRSNVEPTTSGSDPVEELDSHDARQ